MLQLLQIAHQEPLCQSMGLLKRAICVRLDARFRIAAQCCGW